MMLQKYLLQSVMVSALLGLSACGGWLGEQEAPPLPGERISVLAYDQTLVADTSVQAAPFALPEMQANSHWITAGGNLSHVGGHYALSEAALDEAWSQDIGDSVDADQPIMPSPIVVGSVVYTIDSGANLTAFNNESGKELWDTSLQPEGMDKEISSGGLTYANGQLFAATGYGEIIALAPDTGAVIWRSKVATPLRSAPVANEGRVFVVTIDNQLVALDAVTGQILWTHAGIIETAGLLGAPSPALGAEGLLLVAYSSGELYALKQETGRELWSDNLTARRSEGGILSIAAIRAQPVLAANGQVALSVSNSGRLVAMDVRSGQRIWEQRLAGTQMPWVAGDTVFIITNQSQLVALTLRDGKVRWVQQLPAWEYPDDRMGLISWYGPVLAGGKLWLTNSAGRLKAYDPQNGGELETLKLDSKTNRAPIVSGGMLYTLSDSAELTAWR